ncbi:hypothetical protein Agub_g2323 [Astrephomene gubernaculifera]|uniref:Hemoglobin n=1 Tax=Astrephomene gubernaculifera TaxID=47775 RepID=A0AAD3HHK7_9CHLO|nr:hypothetical protein Agub_g2323 [Astrephomene gubernaculifera]
MDAASDNTSNIIYKRGDSDDEQHIQAAGGNDSIVDSGSGSGSANTSSRATLHTKLGGAPAVAATVDVFYKKVMGDPDLAPFFQGVDMVTLIAKQNRFLSYAFGATTNYNVKDIVMGHAHLIINRGLNLTHFDKVAGHFVDSLKEMGVMQDLIDEAAGVLISVRPLFDPERYKGKIDVEKLEKAAIVPNSKGGKAAGCPVGAEEGSDRGPAPACCVLM